jgi:hypothetical protein
MNYFAHGRLFIDDPYCLAGTAVPDWLNVVDRGVRVRSRHALPHLPAADPRLAAIAAGIVQHCHDDRWFHQTRAFAELSLDICRQLRETLPVDDGFRPYFLGHILVELLLDAELIGENPALLEAYYDALDRVEPAVIEEAVSTIAGRRVSHLAAFIPLFSRERFLWDYSDDGKLLFRLNQVMRRVGLPRLPPRIVEILGAARSAVAQRRNELLAA